MLRSISHLVPRHHLILHMLRRQSGFTLMEILIAQAILGVIGVVFLMALGTSFRAQGVNREEFTAEYLARAQLEYIRLIPYDASNYDDDVPPPGVTLPSGYTITVTTEDYCDGVGEAGYEPCYDPANIQKNTVKIFRDGQGVTSIEDLKTRR